MAQFETLLVLLLAVAAIALVARRVETPYPILLVLGGLLLAFVPRLQKIELKPELVFVLFLPPLLYPAALFTSWRDFRENLREIALLATGLVLFTMVVTAWLAHHFIGIPLAAAFVLGAIVSPPDAVAALAITERLRVPRRIITILDGEGLVNDATSLVAYRFAVSAVVTGAFSMASATLRFFIAALGGIVMGLAIGWIEGNIQRRLDDPPIQIIFSLLTPFAAYLLAESLGVSGVLAVVTAGLFLGWRLPEIINARMRLQAGPVWEIVQFILNGLVFILIGVQLPDVVRALSGQSPLRLAGQAALISAAVIVVRIIWVFAGSYLPRGCSRKVRSSEPCPSWKHLAIIGWSGMRGVDSLAAALAIPLIVQNGAPFPARNLILFLTYGVILATLVFQGLTLPALIRRLGVKDDRANDKEEQNARLRANQAALARLDQLAAEHPVRGEPVERLRAEYRDRIRQLEMRDRDGAENETGLFPAEFAQFAQEALEVERGVILQLRNQGVINDEVLRSVQRDIDLAEARLGHPGSQDSN